MISIIVPAYNVEDYLESCVNSILNSTFRDFELILVDDGSVDKTPELCDRFSTIDERVHVIHHSNGGVAAARNTGLKASKGDYITFVDSDDLVHPQMLEILWKAISSGDFDMSMVFHRRIRLDEGTHFLNCTLEELGVDELRPLTQEDYMSSIFTDLSGHYAGPCHKFYKRELLLQPNEAFVEFKPIPAEDTEWLIRILLRMKKFVQVPMELYFYVMRDDSLTHAQSNKGLNPVVIGRLETVYQCLELLPYDKPHYRALCLKDLYRRILRYNYLAFNTPYKEELRLLSKRIYKATIKEYLQIPMSRTVKMKNVLYCKFPWLHRWIIDFGEWMVKTKLIKG